MVGGYHKWLESRPVYLCAWNVAGGGLGNISKHVFLWATHAFPDVMLPTTEACSRPPQVLRHDVLQGADEPIKAFAIRRNELLVCCAWR